LLPQESSGLVCDALARKELWAHATFHGSLSDTDTLKG
jgi:hypothetical protein